MRESERVQKVSIKHLSLSFVFLFFELYFNMLEKGGCSSNKKYLIVYINNWKWKWFCWTLLFGLKRFTA